MLAQCGYGSLRGLEELIIAGRITVNRQPAEIGHKVGPNDQIRINGEPCGCVSRAPRPACCSITSRPAKSSAARIPEDRPTVFDKLPRLGSAKWIAVGRLDFNSEGLLLFTTSGELANRLMHPRYEVEREYSVRVMGTLTAEQERELLQGVRLDDGMARVTLDDGGGEGANHWYKLTLPEGRNREVRRLFEALGSHGQPAHSHPLRRVAMPPQLKRGQTVELERDELARLVQAAGMGEGGSADPGRDGAATRNAGEGDEGPCDVEDEAIGNASTPTRCMRKPTRPSTRSTVTGRRPVRRSTSRSRARPGHRSTRASAADAAIGVAIAAAIRAAIAAATAAAAAAAPRVATVAAGLPAADATARRGVGRGRLQQPMHDQRVDRP